MAMGHGGIQNSDKRGLQSQTYTGCIVPPASSHSEAHRLGLKEEEREGAYERQPGADFVLARFVAQARRCISDSVPRDVHDGTLGHRESHVYTERRVAI